MGFIEETATGFNLYSNAWKTTVPAFQSMEKHGHVWNFSSALLAVRLPA